MKTITNNEENIIEFKHITGQNMIEEIKELFLEYSRSLKVDLSFQNFKAEFDTLPGKYRPPDGVLILALVDGKEVRMVQF